MKNVNSATVEPTVKLELNQAETQAFIELLDAAAATGTLTNAPAAGNPTKWFPINDNGTTRYVPSW